MLPNDETFTESETTPSLGSGALQLEPIAYRNLNAIQQESFNFQKLAAVLADFGYITMRLSDDWKGADFVAQHVSGHQFLPVQLKGRVYFGKKYQSKGSTSRSSKGRTGIYIRMRRCWRRCVRRSQRCSRPSRGRNAAGTPSRGSTLSFLNCCCLIASPRPSTPPTSRLRFLPISQTRIDNLTCSRDRTAPRSWVGRGRRQGSWREWRGTRPWTIPREELNYVGAN